MSTKQTAILLDALKTGPMTAAEIWRKLGIARASARVYDLRDSGFDVRSEMITVRNRHGERCRVARYSLMSARQSKQLSHPGRGAFHHGQRAAA